MTIAVVDSDGTRVAAILQHLIDSGFDTIIARVDDRATLQSADLIVTGTDVEAIARIRALVAKVPIIAAAPAMPAADHLLELFRHGASDFVDSVYKLRERIDIVIAKTQDAVLDNRFLVDVERDQEAGRQVQRSLLPKTPLELNGYRFYYAMRPSLLLSGDFVDYFRITANMLAFYIADVSGHGASSAFVTLMLRNLSRKVLREVPPRGIPEDPAHMLSRLNREFLDLEVGKHATYFLGLVDVRTNEVAYANAGHFPQPIFVASGSGEYLTNKGKPIGLFPKVSYQTERREMHQDDVLVVQSDGVLEYLEASTLKEKEQRLLDGVVAKAPDIDAIWQGLGVLGSEPGPDDSTCLVVQRCR